MEIRHRTPGSLSLIRSLPFADRRHSHRLRFRAVPSGHPRLLYRRRAVRILGHEDHEGAAAVAKRPQLRISARTIHRVDAVTRPFLLLSFAMDVSRYANDNDQEYCYRGTAGDAGCLQHYTLPGR